ncbi:MAG: DUF362 domain-containing protein [Promethearchaeota archaeon]
MPSKSNVETKVAVIKNKTHINCIKESIEKMGGIKKFIQDGDQVFIKTCFSLPSGFPANVDMNSLRELILMCKNAGAEKIYVGDFPYPGISIRALSELLGLELFLKKLGAELAYLDGSNLISNKNKLTEEDLSKLKSELFTEKEISDGHIFYPKIIDNSDKLIVLNQVNVHPLFKVKISLLNLYSSIPNSYQCIKIEESKSIEKDKLYYDNYKARLISKIIDIAELRPPDLVINDLFYILEGAGPYIYRDSNLKEIGVVISGTDIISADLMLLKMLNLDLLNKDLIEHIKQREFGGYNLSNIEIIGADIDSLNFDIKLCESKFEKINIRNLYIHQGSYCSGCFLQAYYLLNLIKTIMIKDMKYLGEIFFLIGKDPLDPDISEIIEKRFQKSNNFDLNSPSIPDFKKKILKVNGHTIIFGDCAINSTKNRAFRQIKVEIFSGKKQFKRKQKIEPNKLILELSGCPPNIYNCIIEMVKYFKKGDVPTLNLFYKTLKYYYNKKEIEILRKLEVI